METCIKLYLDEVAESRALEGTLVTNPETGMVGWHLAAVDGYTATVEILDSTRGFTVHIESDDQEILQSGTVSVGGLAGVDDLLRAVNAKLAGVFI